MARMIRKPNRARLTSEVALLLWYGIGLLVRHGSDHAGEVDGTIAFASRGHEAPHVAPRRINRAQPAQSANL